MIVVISDLDFVGSGYMNITLGLCNEMVARGKRVTALGIGYAGQEHHWPFSIIPIDRQSWAHNAIAATNNLIKLGAAGKCEPVEAVVVALDIPWQHRFRKQMPEGVPYIAIFPVEDGPVTETWAAELRANDVNFVISQHGKRMLDAASVPSHYLPVGFDRTAWRNVDLDTHNTFKTQMGFGAEDFVVLTVADNQERKNLSAAADIIAKARETYERVHWVLVTRSNSGVGWNLEDYVAELGMTSNFMLIEKGRPFKELWRLYAMADLFLLTSKAEGLCMPVLEAMSCAVPVLATHSSALIEHIFEDYEAGVNLPIPGSSLLRASALKRYDGQRGWTIPPAFRHRDVFGNSWRTYADTDMGAAQMQKIIKLWLDDRLKLATIQARAMEYVDTLSWQQAGNVFMAGMEESIRAARQKVMKPMSEVLP